MPGQLVHLALIDSLLTTGVLNSISTLTPSIRDALNSFQPFCRLGAVSPDCASVVGQDDATGWSNIMHYVRPADFVRYAMPEIWKMHFNASDTKACIAWLFGYTAHLVADDTIHPVVAALVGPYAIKKNRRPHRLCEFNQDVYIFFKLNQKEVSEIDFLQATGLKECSRDGDLHRLSPAILDLWTSTLQQYPREETKRYVRLPKLSLNPNCWFATYLNVMENFATKGSIFAKLFGCAYMKADKVDPRYIQDLPTPKPPATIPYDVLYEKTRQNLIQAWRELAEALEKDDVSRFTLANANLDTGADQTGKIIYWA
jgi:hypothetical protein